MLGFVWVSHWRAFVLKGSCLLLLYVVLLWGGKKVEDDSINCMNRMHRVTKTVQFGVKQNNTQQKKQAG